MAKISIAIPYYAGMKNAEFFLNRCVESIKSQTFTDYEIVITEDGKMAENSNSAIKKSTGELIKVLYMDDYFAHPNALQDIVDNFEGEWLITGTDNNPNPKWTQNILAGNNRLGSPSALTFRNHFEDNLLFDERLTWILDCELYWRMYKKYGLPKILKGVNVNIGVGDHQASNILTQQQKISEHVLVNNEYDNA